MHGSPWRGTGTIVDRFSPASISPRGRASQRLSAYDEARGHSVRSKPNEPPASNEKAKRPLSNWSQVGVCFTAGCTGNSQDFLPGPGGRGSRSDRRLQRVDLAKPPVTSLGDPEARGLAPRHRVRRHRSPPRSPARRDRKRARGPPDRAPRWLPPGLNSTNQPLKRPAAKIAPYQRCNTPRESPVWPSITERPEAPGPRTHRAGHRR